MCSTVRAEVDRHHFVRLVPRHRATPPRPSWVQRGSRVTPLGQLSTLAGLNGLREAEGENGVDTQAMRQELTEVCAARIEAGA